MKTAIATFTAGLLVLGGLAWAQMGPGQQSGMLQQHSAATAGAQTKATQETSECPMHGAGGMMSKMMGMMGNRMEHMMGATTRDNVPFIQALLQQREQLGLALEQVQQLQTIANEARKALIRHEAEAQVTEVDLTTLMQADPVDLTQVKEAVNRLESQHAEGRLARLNAIAKAKAFLTPEQRQRVSVQTAAVSHDMSDMMECPMMGSMMGHQPDTSKRDS